MPIRGDLPAQYNQNDEHVGYLRGQPGFDPTTTTSATLLAETANQVPAPTRGYRASSNSTHPSVETMYLEVLLALLAETGARRTMIF